MKDPAITLLELLEERNQLKAQLETVTAELGVLQKEHARARESSGFWWQEYEKLKGTADAPEDRPHVAA